ncbi:MAG TPA: triphosphoribosyl-dephospho-CoA synthase, partial [Gemmatales bacterium]|nr:triphosphoribosyl-dephospho-CoA synthase [Gemmatales bacterium]
GKVDEHDVTQIPTISLLEAMHHARDRDLLAKAYCTRYHDVFEVLLPFFEAKYHWFSRIWNNPLFFRAVLYRAVQATFLHGIATLGETLIRRKCGTDIESEAQSRAKEILDAGWPETRAGLALYIQYDAWLRSDGHRRNPGTMADLMAAVLFLALEKGVIPSQPP